MCINVDSGSKYCFQSTGDGKRGKANNKKAKICFLNTYLKKKVSLLCCGRLRVIITFITRLQL